MSVAVDLARLGEEIGRFGPIGYVLTVDGEGRPHAVSVPLAFDGERVTATVGRSTAANATARTSISLLWSPVDAEGFSLIVDGAASVDGDRLTVAPARAILHRTREGRNDCVNLEP